MLISDQRAAREEDRQRAEQVRVYDEIADDTARFWDRFVAGGLELCAAEADNTAYQIDVAFHHAKHNRRLVAAMRGQESGSDPMTWSQVADMQGALGNFSLARTGFAQAALLPFPGDFMQSALALNRCIALAQSWCERYPWTQEPQLPTIDQFITDLRTTLGAAARDLQAAAAVVRQMSPRRYADWFPAVRGDPRLLSIAADLKSIVDEQLRGAPLGEDGPGDTSVE